MDPSISIHLPNILASHAHWLAGEDGGERADLIRADLTGADLREACLIGADLTGADLTGAALTGAILTGAILTGAELRCAVGLAQNFYSVWNPSLPHHATT